MKLLLDMNVSPAVAERLRQAGLQAVHWSQVGAITANDPAITAYAATNGYVIVTHDLDFAALHARTNAQSPSVILVRADDLSVAELAARLEAVAIDVQPELEAVALVTIDLLRTRVRILPLRPQ